MKPAIVTLRAGQAGFSLIEAMTVIGILAVIYAIAAPAMTAYVSNAQVAGLSAEIVTAMRVARAEAIRSGRDVTFCAADAASGTNAGKCSGASGWAWKNGWLVVDNGGTVLKKSGPLDGYTFSDPTSGASYRALFKGAVGTASGTVPALTVCRKGAARTISLTRSGLPSAASATPSC
ncbi:GspH/FimT family pseudopilin [Chitinimonas koreensis]|uniref:GspH/FimT family pseudopilin n=1 Tax=Chitinimonas koreensis TaxID=356302 RepID=UPI000412958E|nr:GspH/FimT family pseudopilin [Chitinimonas koreensis]